jgi:hypothetical protein
VLCFAHRCSSSRYVLTRGTSRCNCGRYPAWPPACLQQFAAQRCPFNMQHTACNMLHNMYIQHSTCNALSLAAPSKRLDKNTTIQQDTYNATARQEHTTTKISPISPLKQGTTTNETLSPTQHLDKSTTLTTRHHHQRNTSTTGITSVGQLRAVPRSSWHVPPALSIMAAKHSSLRGALRMSSTIGALFADVQRDLGGDLQKPLRMLRVGRSVRQ